MSIADDILQGRLPNSKSLKALGDEINDFDEYGYPLLIEAVIARNIDAARLLLELRANVDEPDITGRTALHWAVDANDVEMVTLLLESKANPNAFTKAALPVLVYPMMRRINPLKHLLYRYGAKIDFVLDFIHAKSIGHRFELMGRVDILTHNNQYIEVDYEGFIVEFSVDLIKDSIKRFMSSYATRHLRPTFPIFQQILDGFFVASDLLQFQWRGIKTEADERKIQRLLNAKVMILPAASEGHAIGFVKYKHWWAKVDRGENSNREPTATIYRMETPSLFTIDFIKIFLMQRQPQTYFHQTINEMLGLKPIITVPLSQQISGNCSFANIQGIIPVLYAMITYENKGEWEINEAMRLFEEWIAWDKDRVIDEAVQRFYQADKLRQISLASMLASVIFQATDNENQRDMRRAESIIPILDLPEMKFILNNYLEFYCEKKLTRKGNNLLKVLDELGINPNIGVTAIATGLKKKKQVQSLKNRSEK